MLEWTGDGEPQSVRQELVLEGSEGMSRFTIQWPLPPSKSEYSNYYKRCVLCTALVYHKNK